MELFRRLNVLMDRYSLHCDFVLCSFPKWRTKDPTSIIECWKSRPLWNCSVSPWHLLTYCVTYVIKTLRKFLCTAWVLSEFFYSYMLAKEQPWKPENICLAVCGVEAKHILGYTVKYDLISTGNSTIFPSPWPSTQNGMEVSCGTVYGPRELLLEVN